jgi:hypothetical protein
MVFLFTKIILLGYKLLIIYFSKWKEFFYWVFYKKKMSSYHEENPLNQITKKLDKEEKEKKRKTSVLGQQVSCLF